MADGAYAAAGLQAPAAPWEPADVRTYGSAFRRENGAKGGYAPVLGGSLGDDLAPRLSLMFLGRPSHAPTTRATRRRARTCA